MGDLPEFDDAARIGPYVSVAASGAHTLTGPRHDRDLAAITPERLDDLIAFASRFYELIVLDVADRPEPMMRAAVERADETVLVSTPDSMGDSLEDAPALDALEELRDERATLVLNAATEQQVRAFAGGGATAAPHTAVPHDRDQIRALDAGDFRLDRAAPETRVALKRLALAVMEGIA
jgi:MinD-like ATPase involved in chromosome partitioning or flagellar assembly